MNNPVKEPIYVEDSYGRMTRSAFYRQSSQSHQLIGRFASWDRDDFPPVYAYLTNTFRVVRNKQ